MKRVPRVVLAEDRQDSSLVTEILSNVYSTVVPQSLRGIAASDTPADPPRLCEVSCVDVMENRVAFGYSTAGFTVWYISSTCMKATEIMCETEGPALRLIRFIPPLRPDPSSRNNKKSATPGSGTEEFNDAWGDVSHFGGTPAGMEMADLAYVSVKHENILKLVSLQSGKIVEDLALPGPIADVKASSRLIGVMIKDLSVHVYVRSESSLLAASKVTVLPHAHPLVLGSRWGAYGANSMQEARTASDISTTPTASPQLQSQSVWGDLTKQLAASAFKLGEASTKKLTGYLQTNGQLGNDDSDSGSSTCACDTIIVRDMLASSEKVITKIMDSPSFLQFDGSESLLVSASRDGQSLHVYSLPKGTLLYRLERGLRPAKIVSASFSTDRKWLAVASSRGTTHVFAIHPTGVRATPVTHRVTAHHSDEYSQLQHQSGASNNAGLTWIVSSMLGSAGSPQPGTRSQFAMNNTNEILSSTPPNTTSSEPKYMMEIQHEIVPISSIGKVSQSSSSLPLRGVSFPSSGLLRTISGNGVVEDFRLVPGSSLATERDEPEKLVLGVRPLRAYNLTRDVKETMLPATPFANGTLSNGVSPSPSPTSSLNNNKNLHSGGDELRLMEMLSFDVSVSNFEMQTSVEPLVPTWASPQLTMIQIHETDQSDPSSLFYAPEGEILEVRGATPPPGLADAIRTPAFGS